MRLRWGLGSLVLCPFLFGCGNDPVATEFREQFALASDLATSRQATLDAERLAGAALEAIDGPVILAIREDGGGIATLVPATFQEGKTVWSTLTGQTVTLEGGRIAATRGLGDDLMSSGLLRTGDLMTEHLGADEVSVSRVWTCFDVERTNAQVVLSDGRRVRTARQTTSCTSEDLSADHSVWRAETGSFVMIRQWISPGVGYLRLEKLR